jgi:tRNA-uridine 2-sulfurtransferase
MIATSRHVNAISQRWQNSSHKPKKALVAISGGIDSAVSAALLKKQGLNVAGVFFDFGDWGKSSLAIAKKVAQNLGISLKIVNARNQFRKKIIGCFVSSYKKGITPNPCVVCNREMKFQLLLDLLKKEKADFVATGHYVRLRHEIENMKIFSSNLLEAKDKSKDQSYFLYRLAPRDLAKIIFPLGGYKKTEVKKMAKKFKLPFLGDKESQDICFLLNGDINNFLKKRLKPKTGNIIDEKKNILGNHRGLPFYTIGQRKGIEIGGRGPYFVIGKNSKKNELIVSSDPKKLLTKKFEVNRANWIKKGIKFPLRARVQVRYHAEKIPAIIKSGKSKKYTVETEKYLRAVTPGQSAVFFEKDGILGGGIIT